MSINFHLIKSNFERKELYRIGIKNYYENTYNIDIYEVLIEHSSLLKEKNG